MVRASVAPVEDAPPRGLEKGLALEQDPEQRALLPARGRGRVSTRIAVLLALAGRVWATVAQSEASQALQQRGQFNKPFFIVCFNHTLTGVLVPLVLAYHRLAGTTKADCYDISWVRDPVAALRRHSVLPLPQLVASALFLSFFFLFVDYFWYAALTGVSVTAATAIGTSTPLFVYCFSICVLRERVTLRKVGGVLVAFVGVSLVVLFQHHDAGEPSASVPVANGQGQAAGVLAAMLVLVSSAFCAGYDVAFKFLLGAELTDTSTVLLLAGLSGLFTVPMWVVGSILVAHSPLASLREPFGWPESGEAAALLVLSALLAVLINACTPLLLSWTSPLETSVGGMLVVPLSDVWDVAFHGTAFSPLCVVGAALVLAGFGVLEYVSTKG